MEALSRALSAPASRWHILSAECLGVLMVILDSTIVNVALPTVKLDLGFSAENLVWVVNAYLIPYAGCLLVCGRLGDYYGGRPVFLTGVALFTAASLACACADSQTLLIAGRALQGMAAAAVSAVSLSLIMKQFEEPAERAKAVGILSCVCAAGGSLGLLLGGILTSGLNWRWVFLVNVPVGLSVHGLCFALLPRERVTLQSRVDVLGGITVTGALILMAYSLLHAADFTRQSLGPLCLVGALVLFLSFCVVESKTRDPLVPLRLFRHAHLTLAIVAGVLWNAAVFAWFFVAPQHLQFILKYDALKIAMAFLPATVVMAVCSLSVSARVTGWLGVRLAFAIGLTLMAAGLGLLARLPADGTFLFGVAAPMLLIGVGSGLAYNPWLLHSMSRVSAQDYGVVSGMLNSVLTMAGAMSLALFSGIAAVHTRSVLALSADSTIALSSGYHLAFGVAALLAAAAAVLAASTFDPRRGRR